MRRATGFSFLLFLALASTAIAQEVTLRSAGASEAQAVASPMVLDLSLEKVFKSRDGIDERGLVKYTCKGISIPQLKLRITRQDKGGATLWVTVRVNNSSDKDRDVALRFEVTSGDSSLGSGVVKRFEVEEDQTLEKQLSFLISLPAEITLPYPLLRVSVELINN